MDGEKLDKLCIERNLLQAGVFVNAMEEVGLFVVVWGEDNVVNRSLKDLNISADVDVTM